MEKPAIYSGDTIDLENRSAGLAQTAPIGEGSQCYRYRGHGQEND